MKETWKKNKGDVEKIDQSREVHGRTKGDKEEEKGDKENK